MISFLPEHPFIWMFVCQDTSLRNEVSFTNRIEVYNFALFVEEMMDYPLIYLVLPFLLPDGERNQ